jgi:hypothetical protein
MNIFGGRQMWTKTWWTKTCFTALSLLAWAVFLQRQQTFVTHLLFLRPCFLFYFVASFHFCCCSFLALLFTPHVRPFLSSSFAGLFCSKYVAFWLHHFVSFALAVLGQLDVLLPLMFSPTTRPWLYKWIWVWHVPTQWRLVL